jgi:hypothetical protein
MRASPRPKGQSSSIKPAICYQSSSTGRHCEGCGQQPVFIHLPIHQTGYYCSKCCPACPQKPAAKE